MTEHEREYRNKSAGRWSLSHDERQARDEEIRRLYREGWTQERLGERYGLKACSVSHIVNRK